MWTRKADFPGTARQAAVGFSINSTAIGIGTIAKGYLGTGVDAGGIVGDFYEYDQATDTWTSIDAYLGGTRRQSIGFSIGNCGYVGMGRNGAGAYTKDFYRYAPDFELPIHLLSFSGKMVNGTVQCRWETATETNNDFFTIERSADGTNFEIVSTVKGAGTSTSKLNYTSVDESPLKGTSYYRLVQTDFDGKFTYSKLVPVENNTITSLIFPNPTNGSPVNIRMNGIQEREVLVMLYNALGETVYSKLIINDGGTGILTTTIDPKSNLTPGVYYIVATSKNELFRNMLVVSEQK